MIRRKPAAQMYPYTLKFRGRRTTLLWCSGRRGDVFFVEHTGKLLTARSLTELKRLLRGRLDVHWKEHAELDLDSFWRAVQGLRAGRASAQTTCRTLLNGWNFTEDLLRTLGAKREGRGFRTHLLNRCYDKVFFGSNLPSVTPKSKRYQPIWTREEITALRAAFAAAWERIETEPTLLPQRGGRAKKRETTRARRHFPHSRRKRALNVRMSCRPGRP